MLLTETNMIHYLLGNGLAGTKEFVKGDYSCRGSNGRHRHFIINKEFAGQKLFVKQAHPGIAEKTNSVSREGLFYKLAMAGKNFETLQPYLPGLLLFDEKNAALVLEYYHDHIDLYDRLINGTKIKPVNEIAREVGTALFLLHSIKTDDLSATGEPVFFDEIKPWILHLPGSKNTAGLAARSVAEQQSIRLIFSIAGFKEMIATAAQLWQPSCIIHGDCKLNNFLLGKENDKAILKWIDWELVSAGDPLWDLATVFQSLLTSWVVSQDPLFISENNKKTSDAEMMQEFIAVCWARYAMHNAWSGATEKEKLEKCTAFTALRLLHSCFETTATAKNLQPYSARLLQLAHNILTDPAVACSRLFGIKLKA